MVGTRGGGGAGAGAVAGRLEQDYLGKCLSIRGKIFWVYLLTNSRGEIHYKISTVD